MRCLLVAVLLLTGCAAQEQPPPASVEGESVVASGVPCVAPSPLPSPPAVPLVLPAGSVVVAVTEQAGQRLVTGRVPATVEEVLEHFRSDPAYVVSRDEDEGRSGRLQLFGAAGDVGVAVALLTCPRGQTGFTVSETVTQPSPSG